MGYSRGLKLIEFLGRKKTHASSLEFLHTSFWGIYRVHISTVCIHMATHIYMYIYI